MYTLYTSSDTIIVLQCSSVREPLPWHVIMFNYFVWLVLPVGYIHTRVTFLLEVTAVLEYFKFAFTQGHITISYFHCGGPIIRGCGHHD